MDLSASTMPPHKAMGTTLSGATPSWTLAARCLTSGEAVGSSPQGCLSCLLMTLVLLKVGEVGGVYGGDTRPWQLKRSSPSLALSVVLLIPMSLLTSFVFASWWQKVMLCLHHPLSPSCRTEDYLHNHDTWSICLEPEGIVAWNTVLFSLLLLISAAEMVLASLQILNGCLGCLCGFCEKK